MNVMGKSRNVITTLLLLYLCIPGCKQEQPQSTVGDNQVEKSQNSGQEASPVPLRLYNWEDYTGSETVEKLRQATGIDLQVVTFDDDETILGALQSGAIEADVIVVSQSLAREMQKAKLLLPIDYGKIPNSTNIKERYIPEPDEKGMRYSVPYLWGTTGLVVNTKHVTGDYNSWAVLWDPRYKGKIATLNNAFDVAAIAAKLMGYPVNPTLEQLDDVEQKLLAQKDLVIGYYDSVTLTNLLQDEKIWAAPMYNGDGLVMAEESEDLVYVTPREGSSIWVDVFVIPKHARNPEQAHTFINFIHTPEVMGAIASEYWFASTNKAAEKFMDPEVLAAKSVYPPEETMKKSEPFGDMGSGASVRKRVEIFAKLTRQ